MNSLIVPGRRRFLRAGATAAMSSGAFALLAGLDIRGASAASSEKDIGVLNTALAAEQEAIAAYQVGAESGLLQKPVLNVAVGFQSDHKAHADALRSTITKLGGKPMAEKKIADYKFPTEKLKTQNDVLRFAAGLEKGAVSAYLGAVPVFDNRDLARAAASILGNEAQHWTVLLQVLGENPVPAAFVS